MARPEGTADLYIQVGASPGAQSVVVVRVRQVAPGYLADELTADQARELADALLAAAEEAEKAPGEEV
jgi:hypothetical protein